MIISINMKTKICTKCKVEKEATREFFYKKRDSLNSSCKDCLKKRGAKYRQENKEKIKKQKDKYYQKNKDEIAKYYQDNKDEIAKKHAKYRQENKEKITKWSAKYYEDNKDEISKYYEENKEKIAKQKTKHYKENKDEIAKRYAKYVKKLFPHYVAKVMQIPVADLTPEIYETKKLIIQLKRELKDNNVKIN